MAESLPKHPSKVYPTRPLSGIKYRVIHHSGVDVDSSPEAVARYHIETLGWPGVGYTWLISWDGTIYMTNWPETMCYNVSQRNHEVMGILLVGDYSDRWPRPAQLSSARILTKALGIALPDTELKGHYEVALPTSPTACPGRRFPEWRLDISQ